MSLFLSTSKFYALLLEREINRKLKLENCICGLTANRAHVSQNSPSHCVSVLSVNFPKIRQKLCKTCMKGPVEHQFQPDAKSRGELNMQFPHDLKIPCVVNYSGLLQWSLC